MKLTLFYDRSVHSNAAHYYELAKEGREKAAGLENAMKETEKELGAAKKGKKKAVRVKREKEWHEKFHFAFTSGGKLMLGGRNAQQNDLLFAKHMDDADLFFHADIQGASAVILKGGAGAAKEELAEAAQFAASFSKAWINGNASVDVYAVSKGQVSKHAAGGFIPSGAFAISGERAWFRDTKLALRLGMKDGKPALVPDISAAKLERALVLVPSQAGKEKGALARSLAKRYNIHPDELLELLPNGKTKTLEAS
jgi:predicted ribosome quality control (RQC) complex YloA/Tae2 family protein